MIRKLLAAWKIISSDGYILCTIQKDRPNHPDYDHNVTPEDVLLYNGYINSIYYGCESALNHANEILYG